MVLKILVGCEESQAVTKEFRRLGHEAYSCDIQECSGGFPEWHLKGDIFEYLSYMKWDIVILHPPCTKISVSGNRHYGVGKPKHQERLVAVAWTQKLWDAATSVCNFVAMENPVGTLNTYGDFPTPKYIQPYQFGHGETKKTGLWLYNLPELLPTKEVAGREQRIWKMPPHPDRTKNRSKTYPGIAKAIAEQYSNFVLQNIKQY